MKAELKTINQKNIFDDSLCITVENAKSNIENEVDAQYQFQLQVHHTQEEVG